MTFAGWLTIVLFAVILTALAFPLGQYMANVYTGKRVFLTPVLAWPERFLYRVLRVDPQKPVQEPLGNTENRREKYSLAGVHLRHVAAERHRKRGEDHREQHDRQPAREGHYNFSPRIRA